MTLENLVNYFKANYFLTLCNKYIIYIILCWYFLYWQFIAIISLTIEVVCSKLNTNEQGIMIIWSSKSYSN